MYLFKDKETRRWSELRTSSRKDLGTAVTPTTVSGDAATVPSIYVKCLLGLHKYFMNKCCVTTISLCIVVYKL